VVFVCLVLLDLEDEVFFVDVLVVLDLVVLFGVAAIAGVIASRAARTNPSCEYGLSTRKQHLNR